MQISYNTYTDAYPVTVGQKVTQNLPGSFYSPMPEFKFCGASEAKHHIGIALPVVRLSVTL